MSKQDFMSLVKELRARTGIGIGKCKDALEEAAGNLDEAINNLRKAGLASAVKKEGRETHEGLIAFGQVDAAVAVVEVNAETDFVVKNDLFQQFAKEVAAQTAETQPADVAALLVQNWSSDASLTVDQKRATTIQTLGENIQIKRLAVWQTSLDSSIAVYSHMGGKIVVVVEIGGATEKGDLARDIAMHIAAESPEYIQPDDVPEAVVKQEREIAREQVKGKPENIIDKIVDGKIKAYFDGICLLGQKYVKDPSISIKQLLEQSGKDLTVKRFLRWSIGEK